MNEVTAFRTLKKDIVVFHNKNELPYISVPHLHSGIEVYYNISGAKGFMADGKFLKCENRDLIIVPKVKAHKVLVKKNVPYERCIININESVLEFMGALTPTPVDLSFLNEAQRCVRLDKIQHEKFLKLVEEYNRYETEDGLKALSVFSELLSFLKECFEKNMPREVYIEDGELSYCDLIIHQIEESFKTASVSEIADRIFVNEDHANRLFREETGMTIQKYLTIRKIAEAKKHLYLGKSAKEACLLSGFNNYANFMRTFKNYEGYSPAQLETLSKPL